MERDIYEVLLHPIRVRILQATAVKDRVTAGEICQSIPDVPRTTLYRHINVLIDADILTIVEERKIRGSLERSLSLNKDEINRHNTDDVPRQAFRFLLTTYAKFEKYFNNESYIPGNAVCFFNNTAMMLDDSEFERFLSELQALLVRYHLEPGPGRKTRDISIISAPVQEENENKQDQ